MGVRGSDGRRGAFPFPILGVDSGHGSEFINWHLMRWCEQNKTTFTRSRSGNGNDGAHAQQKNWAVMRTVVGYHRYDTTAELLLLNKSWALQSMMTNNFGPQQKLISKVRNGAKATKKDDTPKTPHRRGERSRGRRSAPQTILADTYRELNPAAIQREIQALTEQLLTITTSKKGPGHKPPTRVSIYARIHR